MSFLNFKHFSRYLPDMSIKYINLTFLLSPSEKCPLVVPGNRQKSRELWYISRVDNMICGNNFIFYSMTSFVVMYQWMLYIMQNSAEDIIPVATDGTSIYVFSGCGREAGNNHGVYNGHIAFVCPVERRLATVRGNMSLVVNQLSDRSCADDQKWMVYKGSMFLKELLDL